MGAERRVKLQPGAMLVSDSSVQIDSQVFGASVLYSTQPTSLLLRPVHCLQLWLHLKSTSRSLRYLIDNWTPIRVGSQRRPLACQRIASVALTFEYGGLLQTILRPRPHSVIGQGCLRTRFYVPYFSWVGRTNDSASFRLIKTINWLIVTKVVPILWASCCKSYKLPKRVTSESILDYFATLRSLDLKRAISVQVTDKHL